MNELLTNAEFFLNFERIYSFFQMVKVLDFMNIEYPFLIAKTTHADSLRRSLYKEQTNVLAYYILTMILINNYEDFLLWCKMNNDNFLSLITLGVVQDNGNSYPAAWPNHALEDVTLTPDVLAAFLISTFETVINIIPENEQIAFEKDSIKIFNKIVKERDTLTEKIKVTNND